VSPLNLTLFAAYGAAIATLALDLIVLRPF